jgi:hypothetical protein
MKYGSNYAIEMASQSPKGPVAGDVDPDSTHSTSVGPFRYSLRFDASRLLIR